MNHSVVRLLNSNYLTIRAGAFRLMHNRDRTGDDKVSRLITEAGYKAELHKIETNDGYILNAHRVLSKNRQADKGPILLMHGLFRCSIDYVLTGPKIALAYLLSDNGYDVWIGNTRGNKYSTVHKEFKYKSPEFWDFSVHEIACSDLPAMIDYMLDLTKTSKASYVGHSQGTTALMALLSTQKEFNKKIHQAHFFAPVAFMTHTPNLLIKFYAPYINRIMTFADHFSRINMSTLLKFGSKLSYWDTISDRSALYIYKKVTCPIVGHNKKELEIDENVLPTYFEDMSPIASIYQLVHFLQIHLSGKFQRFDYGEENMTRYNTKTPPEYDLKNVTCPTFLYQAKEDLVITSQDVDHLQSLLPNVQKSQMIPNWNHMDFILGKNSRKVLYENILKELNAGQ